MPPPRRSKPATTRKPRPPRAEPPRRQRQRGGRSGSGLGGRTRNHTLPAEARVSYHQAIASASKFGVYSLGTIGGVLALGYAGKEVADAVGEAMHGPGIENLVKTTAKGDYALGKDGSIQLVLDPAYLQLLADMGLDPSGGSGDPFPTVGQEEDDAKENVDKAIETVFSPLTILAIAAGIALIFYFKGKK